MVLGDESLQNENFNIYPNDRIWNSLHHVIYFHELLNAATEPLIGPLDFRHTYTDMSRQEVLLPNKTKVRIKVNNKAQQKS